MKKRKKKWAPTINDKLLKLIEEVKIFMKEETNNYSHT